LVYASEKFADGDMNNASAGNGSAANATRPAVGA